MASQTIVRQSLAGRVRASRASTWRRARAGQDSPHRRPFQFDVDSSRLRAALMRALPHCRGLLLQGPGPGRRSASGQGEGADAAVEHRQFLRFRRGLQGRNKQGSSCSGLGGVDLEKVRTDLYY